MRTMHPNSIATYEEKVKPELSKRQSEVFEVLQRFDKLTLFEISMQLSFSRKMDVPINTISGRITELRKLGKIQEAGKRSIKGTTFTVWEVVKPKPISNPGTQGNLF